MKIKQHGRQSVSIIGGSAAGFFTGCVLAQKGAEVKIFEAAERLDPTPRSLIVTSRMRGLLGPAGEEAVVNEIRHFELFANGYVAKISLERPDLVIERARLIRSLATQAESHGTEVHFGRRFTHLESNGKGLAFTIEQAKGKRREKVLTDTLVGADGAFSRVARNAGWPAQPTVPLIQAVVDLPEDLALDTTRVWFLPEDTPYFYWLIPESPKRGVLGLIGEDGKQARRNLERFLRARNFTSVEFQAARIPVYQGWTPIRRKVGDGQVYLVGDAAGHVKVTTVGGIVTGFQGAIGVAEAILNNGFSRKLRRLRHELGLHLLIRRALHNFAQADYVCLLKLLNPQAQRSLSTFNRDEVDRLLWRTLISQPRLLLFGVRALLGGNPFNLPARYLPSGSVQSDAS